jgi:hypothetical protein
MQRTVGSDRFLQVTDMLFIRNALRFPLFASDHDFLGSLLAFAYSGLFAWAAVDQIANRYYGTNALKTYVWVPSGTEALLYLVTIVLEMTAAALLLPLKSRSTGAWAGAILLAALAIAPLGNLLRTGSSSCGARFSVLVRDPSWRNTLFLASSAALVFTLRRPFVQETQES